MPAQWQEKLWGFGEANDSCASCLPIGLVSYSIIFDTSIAAKILYRFYIIVPQDGAKLLIECRVNDLLHQHFTEFRVINRIFPITWLPRFPELNPCGF
ncbi:hypothetical protein NPIL_385241 [Nephila pilipes]|uniref:Uncharacterized protein n=1 Tax=Nephila pilipes TaxID=299642 RepID=A0A8X6TAX5_NEPPI|nr:hypothetical protein NPIL_385241 [Nephila pilipes]